MPKHNPMLAKIEAKYAREYALKYEELRANYLLQLKLGMQQGSDAAMMAIDDVFEVDEETAEKFYIAHVDYVNAISSLFIEDSKVDKECVYSKEDIDRRLKQIVGEKNFAPWDDRYYGNQKLGNWLLDTYCEYAYCNGKSAMREAILSALKDEVNPDLIKKIEGLVVD